MLSGLCRFLAFGLITCCAESVLAQGVSNKPYDQDKADFFWIVANNNRLLKSDQEQARFEREICRALECTGRIARDPTFPFCSRYKRASLYEFSDKDWCPANRYRLRSPRGNPEARYWIPFPTSIATVWQEATATYAYPATNERTIRAWRNPDQPMVPGSRCQWMIDDDPDFVEAPCNPTRVPFSGTSLAKIEAYERVVEVGRTYTLQFQELLPTGEIVSRRPRTIRVEDVSVIAIGDSMTSGEGNPHAFIADDTNDGTASASRLDEWWDRRCHRSLLGYASLATAIAAMQSNQWGDFPKYSFTFMNFACSGARTRNDVDKDGKDIAGSGGLLAPYVGTESTLGTTIVERVTGASAGAVFRGERLVAQLDAVKAALCPDPTVPCEAKPDYLVLSIGVNDIGFSSIVAEMIQWCGVGDSIGRQCAVDRLKSRLERLKESLKLVAERVAQIGVKRHVLLMAYPDLTHDEKFDTCDDFTMQNTLGPSYGSDLDWRRMRWLPLSVLNIGVTQRTAENAYRSVLEPLNRRLADLVEELNLQEKQSGHQGAFTWQFIQGAQSFSQFRGWCAKPSWFVRWIHSKQKQGMAPDEDTGVAGKAPALSTSITTGTAHPNVYGHNFLNWQLRCVFESNGILPRGITGEGGLPGQICGWRPKEGVRPN